MTADANGRDLPDQPAHDPATPGVSRREVMRRGALVGGAALWATPMVQSIARPARASGYADPTPRTPGKKIIVVIIIIWGWKWKVWCSNPNWSADDADRLEADGDVALQNAPDKSDVLAQVGFEELQDDLQISVGADGEIERVEDEEEHEIWNGDERASSVRIPLADLD